jgi:hypothetical protein
MSENNTRRYERESLIPNKAVNRAAVYTDRGSDSLEITPETTQCSGTYLYST